MRKLNSILTYIFIVSMLAATLCFTIVAFYYGPCPLLGDLFCYYVLIMIVATIGLIIPDCSDNDLYEGYVPEPDHSEEHEQIQRNLYDKGYDMSKDIEYSDDDIESTDELDFEL